MTNILAKTLKEKIIYCGSLGVSLYRGREAHILEGAHMVARRRRVCAYARELLLSRFIFSGPREQMLLPIFSVPS